MELLTLLVSEPNFGNWSYQSKVLPAQRQAFLQWPANDPYAAFLQQELERAQAYPVSANDTIMNVLGNAVFDVISLAQSPQAAAQEAVTSLLP